MTHGKVAGQIAAIVKDAGHFDDSIHALAIEKEMARQRCGHPEFPQAPF